MSWTKQIWFLLKKEWALELRNKQSISALMVYAISTVFTVYLCVKSLPERPWNAIFWVIILFVVINAVSKVFFQENNEKRLYYYTIADPRAIIFSKLIYNILLVGVLSIVVFLFYILFLPVDINQLFLYIIAVLLGATGLSSTLTMVAAITAKVGSNATLMAVLSFPIILPMIMLIVNVSLIGFTDMKIDSILPDLFSLLLMNITVFVLSYILFPYLWRD